MKHHIISIGISKHQNAQHSLIYPSKDAQEFYDLIADNIDSIGYRKLLVDSEATLARIKSSVGSELRKSVSTDDNVIFYFSGHGTIGYENDNTQLSYYLVPFDVTSDIENSCVSVDYLKQAFKAIECKTKLLFIDSCFSGQYAGAKYYPNQVNKKLTLATKTFHDITGKGEVAIMACDDDEFAIEDPENKRSLFTHFLLEELQEKREADVFPIQEIFQPISNKVTKRAREIYNHKQTPKFSGEIVGQLQLPTFKTKLKISPEFIYVPSTPSTKEDLPTVEIKIDSSANSKEIDKLYKFVLNTSGLSTTNQVAFDRFCVDLTSKISEKWNTIFNESIGSAEKIPDAISKLRVATHQYLMLGNIIAVHGSEQQMKSYAFYVGEILKLTSGRSGYVSVISVPEIIVAEIIYTVGISSIVNNRISQLIILLNQKITIDYYKPPKKMSEFTDIFYSSALGGNAITVHDSLREAIVDHDWLKELSPRLKLSEESILDCFMQVNYLLVIFSLTAEDRMYAYFGHYEGRRIMPLVHLILFDEATKKVISKQLQISEQDLPAKIKELTKDISNSGVRGHWMSIDVRDFSTLGI